MRVRHSGRTSIDVDVQPTDRPFWMVLGQSHNLGWTATADGRDLGQPTLVNGYANGWQVARRRPRDLTSTWSGSRRRSSGRRSRLPRSR